MSSYINIYLVPKKKLERFGSDDVVEIDVPPLLFVSYCRPCYVYGAFRNELAVPILGSEEEYAELTIEKASSLKAYIQKSIEDAQNIAETYYKIAKNAFNDGLKEEIVDLEESIRQMKDALNDVNMLSSLVSDCEIGVNDFEKVLYNMDC